VLLHDTISTNVSALGVSSYTFGEECRGVANYVDVLIVYVGIGVDHVRCVDHPDHILHYEVDNKSLSDRSRSNKFVSPRLIFASILTVSGFQSISESAKFSGVGKLTE